MLNKELINKSFSKQAKSYDTYSLMQREIAEKLVSENIMIKPKKIIDLGCGTGYLTNLIQKKYPQAVVLGLDISEAMILKAKQNMSQCHFLQADIESLPFKKPEFDLVYSSSCLHWLNDYQKAFTNIFNILKNNAYFSFAIFAGKTLFELRESYQKAFFQLNQTGNIPLQRYLSLAEIFLLLKDFQIVKIKKETKIEKINSLKSLLWMLKSWGGLNAHQNRSNNLGQRKIMNLTEQLYQKNYAQKDGQLIVSWQVFYVMVKKI